MADDLLTVQFYNCSNFHNSFQIFRAKQKEALEVTVFTIFISYSCMRDKECYHLSPDLLYEENLGEEKIVTNLRNLCEEKVDKVPLKTDENWRKCQIIMKNTLKLSSPSYRRGSCTG